MKSQGNYKERVAKAQTLAANSEVQPILYECLWEHAKQLQAQGKLIEAIAEAKKIPESSSIYTEVKNKIAEWEGI